MGAIARAMSDTDDAVDEFLGEAEKVLSEYDKGYMNADVALSKLETRIDTLREATE